MPAPQEFHNSTLYFIRAETAVYPGESLSHFLGRYGRCQMSYE
ncbi:MAG: hypothetical protein ACK53Q_09145 [Dolichospermum sp.]